MEYVGVKEEGSEKHPNPTLQDKAIVLNKIGSDTSP